MVLEVESAGSGGVYGHKLSTVVPGSVTGEVEAELSNMDLAMKLHYLRGAYYFRQSDAIDALTIVQLKEPMFPWLDMHPAAGGRIRRAEPGGRPFLKCNDCGVRIIEAKCSRTLDDWLSATTATSGRWKQIVSDKVLGPDLFFSPLLYAQFTKFKCGGMAIGFSWAHVLGDAASAVNCFNIWGQFLSGGRPSKPLARRTDKPIANSPASSLPHSTKLVEDVGDLWLPPNSGKMASFSLQISESKLTHLKSEELVQVAHFELISALIWQCLARIREGQELNTVTLIKNGPSTGSSGGKSNEQRISCVTTDSSPGKDELAELAMLLAKQGVDETKVVEGLVDAESGKPDVVVYGARLTFVDLQAVDFYGLEIKGQKPVHVEYAIDGVGEEGAVLVLPASESRGRVVVLILQEDEIQKVKEALDGTWGIA